ncbi:2151_t:CDS:1, partial [Funneliformis caledonium]
MSHENQHLSTYLSYIATRKTISSLATHEDFELKKYSEFLMMSKDVRKMVGSEPFPETFFKLMKKDINLPQKISSLLIQYYKTAYGVSTIDSIIVLLKVKQFGRLRLEAKIFSLAYSK